MAYEKQFERVKRFLERIDISPDEDMGKELRYLDDVWSFFIHAWSLKDWIKNDDTIQKIDIDTIVKGYPLLMVCADLANGAKHLTMDIPERRIESRVRAKQKSISVRIKFGIGSDYKQTFTDKYGKEYDAIVLAREVVRAWEDIIDKPFRIIK